MRELSNQALSFYFEKGRLICQNTFLSPFFLLETVKILYEIENFYKNIPQNYE